MTSSQHCRYALWNHGSQLMTDPIEWRMTPRSNAYVAIVPPTVLPVTMRVVSAGGSGIQLQVTEAQVNVLLRWLSRLPADVLRPTACDTGTLVHTGLYNVIGGNMRACSAVPEIGTEVQVRLTADVQKIGPLYKTVLRVVDVLTSDVTTI